MNATQKLILWFTIFLLALTPAAAQTERLAHLSGKVLAAGEGAVMYATVYLKGTKYRTTTNENGIYHLQAPAGRYELIVTATGYKG